MTDVCDHCEREIPAGTRVCPFCRKLVLSAGERSERLKRIALTILLSAGVVAATALYRALTHGG